MEGRGLEQEKKRSNWMRVDYVGSLCLGARTCIMAIFFRVIGYFQLQNGMLNFFSKQYKFEHYCSRKRTRHVFQVCLSKLSYSQTVGLTKANFQPH
jgi:hypothetical protein